MKKIIALLLVLAMVFALAACTKKNNGEDENTNDGENTENTDIGENTDGEDENTDGEGENTDGEDTASTGFDYMAADLTEYITLGNYKGLTATKGSTVLSDEEFEEKLNEALSAYNDYVPVTDRAVEEGDTVVIDYGGEIDGVDFAGGTAMNIELVAADGQGYIPGFGSGLIGHMPETTFDINVTFPDPYPNNTDYSGKEAVFHIRLHYIKSETVDTMSIDKLTDDFVTTTFDFETVEDFLASQRENMGTFIPYIAAQELYDQLFEQILNDSEVIKYPEGEVESLQAQAMEYYEFYSSYYGVTVEDAMAEDGITPETLPESIESSVKSQLVLYSLIKELDAEVTQAEIDGKVAYIAGLYGMTVEEFSSYSDAEDLKMTAQYDKVMGLIEKLGNITYTDAE